MPAVRRSLRYWLEKIRKENPAFLTIVSLELPESPIPLIDFQANARFGRDDRNEIADDKDDILDEFLEKVTEAGRRREQENRAVRSNLSRRSQHDVKKNGEYLECTKTLATIEECTRNIMEEAGREESNRQDIDGDCICSEVPNDPRINVNEETEIARTSRSTSPEMTRIIRIAMKYHDQSGCGMEDDGCVVEEDEVGTEDEPEVEEEEEEEDEGRSARNEEDEKDLRGPRSNARKGANARQDSCCTTAGVNVALDFTLNCNSVRLTARDAVSKTTTRRERQERPETRSQSAKIFSGRSFTSDLRSVID